MSYVGRKNVYVGEACGLHTVTVDRDDGVTPFMITCRADLCRGKARSSFYRVDQRLRASHEWYRPDEATVTREERKHPGTREYVAQGGLLLRESAL